jgi:hypothetical protein
MPPPEIGNGAGRSPSAAPSKKNEQIATPLNSQNSTSLTDKQASRLSRPNGNSAKEIVRLARELTSKFPVGRFTCEMSWSPARGLRCEWSPDVPAPRSLNKKEVRDYRAGRDVFLQEIASTIGGNVMVVEARL